jgi:hypothetical protein
VKGGSPVRCYEHTVRGRWLSRIRTENLTLVNTNLITRSPFRTVNRSARAIADAQIQIVRRSVVNG